MKLRPVVVTFALTLSTSALAAPVPRLFPERATVNVSSDGMHALELPVSVVKACRPDLSDLRLWDGSLEVPYVVDSSTTAWKLDERADAKVGQIALDKTACPSLPTGSHCESMQVTTPARGDNWELVFDHEASRFVERVILTVDGKRTVESIYRIPNGPPERTRISLPTLPKSGAFSITLAGDGTEPAVRVHLERGRHVKGGDVIDTPLRVVTRWHDHAGSHVLVERPRGVLPSSLRFDVKGGTFDRAVTIYDSNDSRPVRPIGTGKISRVSLPAAGERVAIEQLDVPLGVPRTKAMEIVIDDGDSPPLDVTVRAVLKQPVLLFDSPTRELTLYFGGGRADAPRYDIARLLPDVSAEGLDGARAEIAARLHAREGVTPVTLGAESSNPDFDPTPLLSSVMHAGGTVTPSVYAKSRTLTLAPSPDGLSRYVLAASDLAAAQANLRDVRVVDVDNRQWPYVLASDIEPVVVDLGKPVRTTTGGLSRYALTLPASPFSLSELDLDIAQPFFDRAARILVRDEAGRESPIEVRISRQLGNSVPQPVAIPTSINRVSAIELEITDGGDAPLDLTSARALMPTSALALVAKAGDYRLLVGNPDDEPPTYELASLRDTIDQLDSIDAKTSPLVDNPAFSRSARMRSGGGRERLLVWVVLGLAVLVLGAMTLRLAQKPDEPKPESPPPAEPKDETKPEEPQA